MKKLSLATMALIFSLSSYGVIPKLCYQTVDNTEFCTTDNLGKVQVFVYNAGWCGPCNTEMKQLPSVYSQFDSNEVVFASLSGAGWSKFSTPNIQFMKEWQNEHDINFVVAAKKGDYGVAMGGNGKIPYTAVVNRAGEITKKGFMSVPEIAATVKKLLAAQTE